MSTVTRSRRCARQGLSRLGEEVFAGGHRYHFYATRERAGILLSDER